MEHNSICFLFLPEIPQQPTHKMPLIKTFVALMDLKALPIL